VVQPEFGFFAYRIAVRAAGAEVRFAPESDLKRSVDCLLAEVDERTRVVFLDNPGNPRAPGSRPAEVRRLHAALPPRVLLVLDGAYAEFFSDPNYEDGIALAREAPNVMITRTFSKIHGLAALRVGWGYASEAVIGAMDRIRAPFNTSIPASSPARRPCSTTTSSSARWRWWKSGGLGWRNGSRRWASRSTPRPPISSGPLPRHARPHRGGGGRAPVVEGGARARLANYGLPDFLRITVGTEAQNRAFLSALEQLPA
jgi:histidinol-phosphate aminotransferase